MSQKLKDALLELDVTNDEHWTQDGLPRLDVLKAKLNGESVTRADIFNVCKSFNRANPTIEAEEADQPEDTTVKNTAWSQVKTGEATGQPRTEVEGDTLSEEGDKNEANNEAETDAQKAELNVVNEGELSEEEQAEADLVEARLMVAEAQNAFNVAQERVDFFRLKREKREKAVPAHTMIQAFQASQAKQRANDAVKINQLRQIASGLSAEEASTLKNGLNDIL